MTVLVTGGSGYIGSHVVKLLESRGQRAVIVDESPSIPALAETPLHRFDISLPYAVERLVQVILAEGVESVIHFAARKQVGESVEKPFWYYRQNTGGLINLLEAMQRTGITKLIFSSSAAVYGIPEVEAVEENSVTLPINPYGETKLIGEWLLKDAEQSMGLEHISLRYFNVAGALADGFGDSHAFNLIPIVFSRLDQGKQPVIFGTDYPTYDGTCIRDYVHVADLADAHLSAMDYLSTNNREFNVFNVGTGSGSSVYDVIHEIERVTGRTLTPIVEPRRAGDPPQLVAKVDRIRQALGWSAKHDLGEIVSSGWSAHRYRADYL